MSEQGQKLAAVGAIGVPMVVETAILGAHFGGTGVLAGLAVGAIGYLAVDEVRKVKGASVSSDAPKSTKEHSQPSAIHRLFTGKSVRDAEKQSEQLTVTQARNEPMERLQPKPPVASRQSYETGELLAPRKKRSGVFLFSQVLEQFTPSLDKIYLGTLEDGRMIFCRAEDLCHVALAGATRGGKSSIMRMLMAQLCYAGANVLILNPHYSRYILDKKEDWTPFEPYLMYDPMECRKYDVIEHYLRQVATEMLPKRLDRFAHSQPVGKPYFLVLDELPAIVDHLPDAPMYLKSILREGAKVGLFLITAAQDFLVSTISPKGGGAVRDCYRTVEYVGGDATTANVLLDMPAKDVPENQLGKGTVMLRCDLVKPAALARVPLVENEALYTLLGPSTYVASKNKRQDDEDELVAYLVSGSGRDEEERHTETLPAQRRHVQTSSYEQHRQRIASRKTPVYARQSTQVVTVPETPHVEASENRLKQDEQSVLEAYQSGLKSGNAIAGMTGISATRVNQCLNKLSAMKLIDWQPKAKA